MRNDDFTPLSFEDDISPEEFAYLMFERTDLDGILYIPGWHYDGPGWEFNLPGSTDEYDSYRCRMQWKPNGVEYVTDKFKQLYSLLEILAEHWEALDGTEQTAKKVLKSQALVDAWNKYLRPLNVGDLDRDKILDIQDKMEIEGLVKQGAAMLAKGQQPEEYEKSILMEYMDVTVSPEEEQYYLRYMERMHKAAEDRVGKGICAYDVIFRARRLCRLMNLHAPRIVVRNEARVLVAALVLHEYGISREVVDNNIRLRQERLDLMSDEELDAYYHPRNTNTRKSMAPLFVYLILKDKTDSQKHMRQQDLLQELEKYPYELFIERKALSRLIHNLADSQLAICVDKTGVWYEQ